jgi:phosphoribosyl-dephospho-CoA transferase
MEAATTPPGAPRPHDLLFLRRPDAFRACDPGAAEAWLNSDWLQQAPLVVRRAAAPIGEVAIGARGLQRNQRCAGRVPQDAVAHRSAPEDLARCVELDAGRVAAAAAALPCLASLLDLAPRLRTLGLAWGPVGGAGFWLASSLPVLRPTSDLDLLVRAPAPLAPSLLAELCALQENAACRVDIQVDTGAGGFALMELARGGKVLLKTNHGPLLLANPWSAHTRCEAA